MPDLPALSETLSNIRRTAERGLGLIVDGKPRSPRGLQATDLVDTLQHILDECAVAQVYLDE